MLFGGTPSCGFQKRQSLHKVTVESQILFAAPNCKSARQPPLAPNIRRYLFEPLINNKPQPMTSCVSELGRRNPGTCSSTCVAHLRWLPPRTIPHSSDWIEKLAMMQGRKVFQSSLSEQLSKSSKSSFCAWVQSSSRCAGSTPVSVREATTYPNHRPGNFTLCGWVRHHSQILDHTDIRRSVLILDTAGMNSCRFRDPNC